MLDVHPPHETAHTWTDFFIHIATIVVGLLIAIGLEQTVEALHHRHQAHKTRETLQQEVVNNIAVQQLNLRAIATSQQELSRDLDALNSDSTGKDVVPDLKYTWLLTRAKDAAWNSAKIDGSLALIPAPEIGSIDYFYQSESDINPTVFAFFTDIDTAASIVEHARGARKLTPADRQQLISLTQEAMGRNRVLETIYTAHLRALQRTQLTNP